MSRLLWIAALLAAVPGSSAAAAAWDERFYNANPMAGDLVLPLPCDGAMVFRPVATLPDTSDALGDQQVRLGSPDAASGHIDYLRRQHLLGAFPDGAQWLYYIGKYEVTRDQWQAVVGEGCPDPGMQGTLPRTGVSWFDAIAFSRALSEWLLANAGDVMPRVGRYAGYVRLPTEAEWEFAARGGTLVDDEVFRAATSFGGEPAPEHAWFQGPTSARGAIKPAGVRKANPLGLHDMLGNAEEFVLEPFRLNRVGRDHGQIGGFVTRGGSFRTPLEEIRSAQRAEYSFFDITTGRALALDTFGLRLVVSAPVGTSSERADAVAAAWQAQREGRGAVATGSDALALLEEARGRVTDLELAVVLADAASELAAERSRAEETAARAMRQAILSGAVFGEVLNGQMRLVRGYRVAVRQMEDQLRIATERGDDAGAVEWRANLASRQARLDEAEADLAVQRKGFLGTIYTLTDDHDGAELTAQAALLAEELRLGGLPETAQTVGVFDDVLLAYEGDPALVGETLIQRFVEGIR